MPSLGSEDGVRCLPPGIGRPDVRNCDRARADPGIPKAKPHESLEDLTVATDRTRAQSPLTSQPALILSPQVLQATRPWRILRLGQVDHAGFGKTVQEPCGDALPEGLRLLARSLKRQPAKAASYRCVNRRRVKAPGANRSESIARNPPIGVHVVLCVTLLRKPFHKARAPRLHPIRIPGWIPGMPNPS